MEIEELKFIGKEVVRLLKAKKFDEIAKQYDYALKHDQKVEEAIKSDFESSANECIGSIDNSDNDIFIKNFNKNRTGLDRLIN